MATRDNAAQATACNIMNPSALRGVQAFIEFANGFKPQTIDSKTCFDLRSVEYQKVERQKRKSSINMDWLR